MIAQTQAVLSSAVGGIASIGAGATAFALAHPAGIGIVLGIGAYFAVNKYWLTDQDPPKTTAKTTAKKTAKKIAKKVAKKVAKKTTTKKRASTTNPKPATA